MTSSASDSFKDRFRDLNYVIMDSMKQQPLPINPPEPTPLTAEVVRQFMDDLRNPSHGHSVQRRPLSDQELTNVFSTPLGKRGSPHVAIARAQAEVERYKRDAEMLRKAIAVLQQSLEIRDAEIAVLKTQAQVVDAPLNAMRDLYHQTVTENRELRDLVEVLESQIADLEELLDS